MTALIDYARRVAMVADEAAVTAPPDLRGRARRDLATAIRALCRSPLSWADTAVLSGHARVLVLDDTFLLATPLYIEYEHHR
ncbi:ABC-type uncharacterized transport system YnjBCD ATPase subunit [Kibdelosporangium banguiense]|uniref:ABC-type uncharacterized transport system YnjBCD ATPase subunit n=1 Tax=Kibdelosporangium banguiense TaxID=1365924 RepID=A0ABS4TQ45_9PSEU|nr:hypothetical protein [Kibdelosporangium banguiense]MBP2326527.1 ABC-type uncharacterized transport system YnjBCD ATPase subunit [Kibdelosporangium banguiense]